MTKEAIEENLEAWPFQPFTLRLTDGRARDETRALRCLDFFREEFFDSSASRLLLGFHQPGWHVNRRRRLFVSLDRFRQFGQNRTTL